MRIGDETIKTAPVGSIQKFSTEDGPGIRTTVFLKGCPLRCIWCHNPEMISFEEELIQSPGNCIHCGACISVCPKGAIRAGENGDITIQRDLCTRCFTCTKACYAKALRPVTSEMTVDDVMKQVLQDRDFYAHTGGGMTISGGEVLCHKDFALALIQAAQKEDISVCVDTSGYGETDSLLSLARCGNVTDVLYDMKCIDGTTHRKLTGVDNQRILNNLVHLAKDEILSKKIMMRMPLIHGLNDDWELMRRTAEFYRGHGIQRVTLLPYHNLGVSKAGNVGRHQETYAAPDDAYLKKIQQLFETEAGMQVEVLGL